MSNAAPASTFSQGAAEEFMEVLTVTYLGAIWSQLTSIGGVRSRPAAGAAATALWSGTSG